MLVLHLRSQDYLTISDNVVIKVSQLGPERVTLAIDAPRDMKVVRGALLDKAGQRPACLDEAR